MPYTRAWDETAPLGSLSAKQIDNQFRDLKTDIRERLDTILGAGKWATDPIATLTGKKLLIPASLGTNDATLGFAAAFEDRGDFKWFTVGGSGVGTGIFDCPLALPPGVTIKEIVAHVESFADTGITATLRLRKRTFAGVVSNVASVAQAAPVTVTLTGLTEVVSATHFYSIRFESAHTDISEISVFGFVVTYDTPNVQTSL